MNQLFCPVCESMIKNTSFMVNCPHCGLLAYLPENTWESIKEDIGKLKAIDAQISFSGISYELAVEKARLLKNLFRDNDLIETYAYLYENLSDETVIYFRDFLNDIFYFDSEHYSLSFESRVKILELKASCKELITFGFHSPLEDDLYESLIKSLEIFKKYEGYENEIIFCYKCLLVLKGENIEYLAGIADQYYKLGNIEKMLNCYNQLINIFDFSNFNILYNQTLAYNDLGETEKAIISCSIALNNKDKDLGKLEELFTILGFDYNSDSFEYLNSVYNEYRMNKLKVWTIVEEANLIDEGYRLYESLDMYYEALALKDKVLDADLLNVYFNKGVTHIKLKQYEEANECFDKAIQIDERYAPAYVNKGICLLYRSELSGYWLTYLKLGLFYNPNDDFAKSIIDQVLVGGYKG